MVRFENLNIETIDVEDGIRRTFDKEPLDELAASIKLHGILQPLVVEPSDEGKYKLQMERGGWPPRKWLAWRRSLP